MPAIGLRVVKLNLSETEIAHAGHAFESDQPTKFRADILGLGVIAVLVVILYHLNTDWLPTGFLGVDVFFVISGFIVSSVVCGRERNRFFRTLYLGRVRRIVKKPFRKSGTLLRLVGLVALASLGVFLLSPLVNEKIQRPLPPEFTRYAPADDIGRG